LPGKQTEGSRYFPREIACMKALRQSLSYFFYFNLNYSDCIMGKEDRFYVTQKQIESEPVHGCG
jgi:hypothetical protein